jgi:pimeloyl-ACP methyl ester carboxylesterase
MDTAPRTVKANGITLAYRAWGPQGAPPLLLLHCRGADGGDWAPIAELPAASVPARRVYAPDLRGHGRSDWPGTEPARAPRRMRTTRCAPTSWPSSAPSASTAST